MFTDPALFGRIRQLEMQLSDLCGQVTTLGRALKDLKKESAAPGPMTEAKAQRRMDDFEYRLKNLEKEMMPLSNQITKYFNREATEERFAKIRDVGLLDQIKDIVQRLNHLERAFPHSEGDLARFFGDLSHRANEHSKHLDQRNVKKRS